MRKRRVMLLGLILVTASAFAQIGIRNISSARVDFFLNDEEQAELQGGSVEKFTLDINQVLLFRVTDWLSGEVKVQRQDEEPVASAVPNSWNETTISVAPIFVVSSFNYIILRYGLGIGSGYERPVGEALQGGDLRGFSHDVTVDANYESPGIFANLTLRTSFYPDLDYWFILPSTALSIGFPNGLTAGARYFFSYNSNRVTDHAASLNLHYQIRPAVQVRTGGVLGYGPSLASGERFRYGALLGAQFAINDRLSLLYQFDFQARTGRGPQLANTLVLDARF